MNFARNVSWSLITKVAGIIIALASSVMTARYLGTEGRGMYAYFTLLLNTIIQFSNFGLPTAIVYTVSKNKNKINLVFWLIISFSMGLFIFCTLVYLIGVPYINPEEHLLFVLVAFNVPLQMMFLLLGNIFIAENRFPIYNNLMFCNNLLTFIGSVLVLVMLYDNKVEWLLVNIVIVGILVNLIGVYAIKSSISKPVFSLEQTKTLLRYGFVFYINTIFGFLIVRANIFFLSYYHGYEAVGIYSVSLQFADIFLLLPSTIAMVLFPSLISAGGDKLQQTIKISRYSIAIMFIISICSLVFAFPVVSVLYGNEFLASAASFLLLLPGLIALGLENIYVMYINTTDYIKKIPFIWIFGFVINTILNIILIPYFSYYGAAISSVLCNLFICLLVLELIRPRPFRYGDFLMTKQEGSEIFALLKKKLIRKNNN